MPSMHRVGSNDAAENIMSKSIRSMGQITLLYTHDRARIVRYELAQTVDESPRRDYVLAIGEVQLIRASVVNTIYLKIGLLTYPIMPRLKCWRLDSSIIFPVPSGGFWRLELFADDNNPLNSLVSTLKSMLDFQSDISFFKCFSASCPAIKDSSGHGSRTMQTKSLSKDKLEASSPSVTKLRLLFLQNEHGPITGLESKHFLQISLDSCPSLLESATDQKSPISSIVNQSDMPEADTLWDLSVPHESLSPEESNTKYQMYDDAELQVDSTLLKDECDDDLTRSGDVDSPSRTVRFREGTAMTVPTSLTDLFAPKSQSPPIERHLSLRYQRYSRVVLQPVVSEPEIANEEWNLIVDELDLKHRSITRRLSNLPPSCLLNSTSTAGSHGSCFVALFLRYIIYLTAHIWAMVTSRNIQGMDSYVEDVKGKDVVKELRNDHQTSLTCMSGTIWQSLETIGHYGRQIGKAFLIHK